MTIESRIQRLLNDRDHCVDIVQHIVICEAEHAIAKLSQVLIPGAVIRLLADVNPAVSFNDQFLLAAAEINDIRRNGVLAHEFAAFDLPAAQN